MPTGDECATAAELARIRSLVIPPAWIDVWICPDPRGHLQATGRDARAGNNTAITRNGGSCVTRPSTTASSDSRRRCRHPPDDLRSPAQAGLPREKVLATVVQLLEKTLIRVGNDEYARSNRSYGLTTMRDGHVEVRGPRVRFSFRGKSGVEHEIDLNDRRLARS